MLFLPVPCESTSDLRFRKSPKLDEPILNVMRVTFPDLMDLRSCANLGQVAAPTYFPLVTIGNSPFKFRSPLALTSTLHTRSSVKPALFSSLTLVRLRW